MHKATGATKVAIISGTVSTMMSISPTLSRRGILSHFS
ncbi:hypothetical protein Xoosp13_5 [Xanthomonas phage Xoo-sp13]|nr:hypothetical protein Xoosp13_5 [Xanthomonas phage Xoo-sp13]